MLAILGGSGLDQLATLSEPRRLPVKTRYGEPSAQLTLGGMGEREVLFLPRHGDGHGIAPHRVNYRANIQALKEAGATRIASVAAVGGIRHDLVPGTLIVPHQIIDYTSGRASTFFDDQGAKVTHIDFTEPYSAFMRTKLLAAAKACGESILDGGVYGVTQGPRLETAAEIDRMERDGADIVGMTAMPEAALAREAGLEYAAIAVVSNYAAGRVDSKQAISTEAMELTLAEAMLRVRRILLELAGA